MAPALISVLFGVISFYVPIPMVIPVIGLALGATSYIQESKRESVARSFWVQLFGLTGTIICGLAVLVFVLG
jgi:hypothetical protein